MRPADTVRHNASAARTPKIPSPTEGCPFPVALAGVPFELPDVADVWPLPPAEEVLELVNVEDVVLPAALVPALPVPVPGEDSVGESVLVVAGDVEAV